MNNGTALADRSLQRPSERRAAWDVRTIASYGPPSIMVQPATSDAGIRRFDLIDGDDPRHGSRSSDRKVVDSRGPTVAVRWASAVDRRRSTRTEYVSSDAGTGNGTVPETSSACRLFWWWVKKCRPRPGADVRSPQRRCARRGAAASTTWRGASGMMQDRSPGSRWGIASSSSLASADVTGRAKIDPGLSTRTVAW
jgi:hypothetical protein